jgi:hypothetical protein
MELKYQLNDAGARERRRLLLLDKPDLTEEQLGMLEMGRLQLAETLQGGMEAVFQLESTIGEGIVMRPLKGGFVA